MLPVVGALLLAAAPPAQDWHELSSTHFTLRTNLDTDTAMRAAVEIARTRSALVAAMWPPVREVGIEPVDIIVFKDRTEFEHYAGDGSRGLYSHSALPPRIILWGSPERWEQRLGPAEMLPPSNPRRPTTVGQDELSVHLQYVQAGSSSVLRHELAHHVASAVYPRLPLWFSEGQAQFLESMKLSEDGRTATIGLINPTAWREYRRIRAIDLHDVLRWTMPLTGLSQSESMGLYGGAWQLYEWLFTTHRTSLRCLQEQLAARVLIADGWTRCFPDIVADQLGPVLWEFSRNGTPGLSEIAVPPLGLEVKVRPLTEAELHLLHAQVALAAPRREDLLQEVAIELNQALALDPASVGVLQLVAPLVSPQGASRTPTAQSWSTRRTAGRGSSSPMRCGTRPGQPLSGNAHTDGRPSSSPTARWCSPARRAISSPATKGPRHSSWRSGPPSSLPGMARCWPSTRSHWPRRAAVGRASGWPCRPGCCWPVPPG